MAGKSHLQRTTELLREQGIMYQKVETYNTWAKKSVDLFHIIDILALDGGFLGLQICGSDWSQHVRKMTINYRDNTIAWIEAGGRIELWGWRKLLKKRGGKLKVWAPRVADVLIINGEPVVEERPRE